MITSGTPAIGPSTLTAFLPTQTNLQKLYISAYIAPPGVNALVAGDEIVNFVGDVALMPSGAAIVEVVANGAQIVAPGDTTYAANTIKIVAGTKNPKVNLLVSASDESRPIEQRLVNVNVQNEDGSIERFIALVLSAKAIKKAGSALPGWEIVYQPMAIDRRIHTAV